METVELEGLSVSEGANLVSYAVEAAVEEFIRHLNAGDCSGVNAEGFWVLDDFTGGIHYSIFADLNGAGLVMASSIIEEVE